MPRTLLTGATGTLGSALRPRLLDAGHTVRATSRAPPAGDDDVAWVAVDLADGTGIEDAVEDVDVVVHAASAALGDTEAVDVHGTKRLLDAAEAAGVSHVCYVSIVGIEDIPYSYYQHKLAAEELVDASAIPSTVVRATQFHQFLADILSGLRWLPVWPLPTKFESQPVDVRDVADELVDYASSSAHGHVAPICGPDVLTIREIARTYRDVHGLRRPIVPLPLPGATASAFRDGRATRPDRRTGTTTWREWLESATNEPAASRRTPS